MRSERHGVNRGRRGAQLRLGSLILPAGAALLASCVPRAVTPPPRPAAPVATPVPAPAPVPPASAIEAGVRAGPAVESLIGPAKTAAALAAFRISCPSLLEREDISGLTRREDWQAACGEVTERADARSFFTDHFAAVEVGGGTGFATGYFEPEIRGSRTRQPGYEVPVYRKPPDIVEQDAAVAQATGTPRRGRLIEGVVAPYHDRGEIEAGALAGRGLELAWAADEIDFFFLQIQGSGRLRLPDGGVMRIGYAGQNGRDYLAIGKLLKERGLLGPGQTTMQGIVGWLRANLDEGRAVMRENKSYIFFQELTGPGPLGALGRPVTSQVTVAADPRFVPLGAPVVLQLDRPEANGLWIAQDTGGAIKGANRFDTFWGAGEYAATTAGGMAARGRAYVLVPKASLARLGTNGASTPQR